MEDILRRRTARVLLEMQRRFNAAFVHKRDAGKNIVGLYRYLSAVERELSRRGVFW